MGWIAISQRVHFAANVQLVLLKKAAACMVAQKGIIVLIFDKPSFTRPQAQSSGAAQRTGIEIGNLAIRNACSKIKEQPP